MRLFTTLIAISAVMGLSSGHVFAQDADGKAPLSEVKGTGVKIQIPEGFEKAASFNGFQQEATGSSVVVTVIPGPYAAITKAFTEEGLATRGVKLISKKNEKLAGGEGLLLNVSQDAHGQTFHKWMAIFGNTSKTTMVTATFPASNADLSKTLHQCVMSVAPADNSSAPISLPFELDDVEGLVLVESMAAMGKTATFTKNGTTPLTEPTDPLFIAAPSLGNVPTGNTKQFATQRLRKTTGTEIDEIQTVAEITIDGISGFEIDATGHLSKSAEKVELYQVMLFPPKGGYFLMTGIVGQEESEEFIPKFKSLAKSWKLVTRESE